MMTKNYDNVDDSNDDNNVENYDNYYLSAGPLVRRLGPGQHQFC